METQNFQPVCFVCLQPLDMNLQLIFPPSPLPHRGMTMSFCPEHEPDPYDLDCIFDTLQANRELTVAADFDADQQFQQLLKESGL